MRYINTLREGETIRNIYLCKGKRSAETRNGKPYDNLILQDKTGTLDGKVWDPNSGGIADYDEKDFIEVYGDIISYNNNLQMNIKQIRKAGEGEYDPADYMPTTDKDPDAMYQELLGYVKQISNSYLRKAVEYYFVDDPEFIKRFRKHSAAKSVHHGFAGGLLEHTLSVVKFCEYMVGAYPILKKDLLYAAAICHDIGKIKESAAFLMSGAVGYEFRTTVVKQLHRAEDMLRIGQWLKGAKAYFLQNFRDSDAVPAKGLTPLSDAELEAYKRLLLPFIPAVRIRGEM